MTLMYFTRSRTLSAFICRDFPVGRTWKQSGWRSGGRWDAFPHSVQQPVGNGHAGGGQALGVVAREEQPVREAPAHDGALNDRDGRRTLESGRPWNRGRGHSAIRVLATSQIFFSVVAASADPSTTTKRDGMPFASTR